MVVRIQGWNGNTEILIPAGFKVQGESESSIYGLLGTANIGVDFPNMLMSDGVTDDFSFLLLYKFIFYSNPALPI